MHVCKGVVALAKGQYFKDEKGLEDYLRSQARKVIWKNVSEKEAEEISKNLFSDKK